MSNNTMPLGVTAVMLPELDFEEQLSLCAEVGVTHYTLRPRIIADDQRDKPYSNWGNHKFDLTPRRLVKEGKTLCRKMNDAGITAYGTLPRASSADGGDDLRVHLEGAAAVGAGRVRIAPTAYPDGRFDYQDLLNTTIDQYKHIVDLARPFGQKIVLETHAGTMVTSPGLALNVCRHFDPAELGVIFDINNFMNEGAVRPNLAVAVLADYIDHCHVGAARRTEGRVDSAGFREAAIQRCPLDQADLHIPSWINALRGAGRNVPLIIEDFGGYAPGARRLAESAHCLRRILE